MPHRDIFLVSCRGTYTTGENVAGYAAQNIINFINPEDIIPELPTKKWGYYRAGRDIVLPELNQDGSKQVQDIMTAFSLIAPNTKAYYSGVYNLLVPVFEKMDMSQLSAAFGSATGEGKSMEESMSGLPSGISDVLHSMLGMLMQHMPDAYEDHINALDL